MPMRFKYTELDRVKHTFQGAAFASLLTLAACVFVYVHTHDIKFTATASNQAPEITKAENDAVSLAALMPSDPRPAHKPAVK